RAGVAAAGADGQDGPAAPGQPGAVPGGSDSSPDGGRLWTSFDTGSFDSVDCAGAACWASGTQGRVARLSR
ncbi:hypothetical protein AB0M71_42790, partial [Amycolatopsis sp. NPDC051114]